MNLSSRHKFNIIKASYNDAVSLLLQKLSFGVYRRPEKVFLLPTWRCNLRCKNCLVPDFPPDELPSDKWKEIITSLKKWLGSFYMIITGGEPLMREDLYQLLNFAYNLGIVTAITTNGTLIDKQTADRLVENGLGIVSISLDSLKEETKDFLRGRGVYKKAMKAVHYLKNQIRLQISTIIVDQNLDEILDLVDFAEAHRIQISFQGLYWRYNNQTTYSHPNDNELWPQDIEKLEHVLDELMLRKRKSRSIMNSLGHLQLIKNSYRHPYHNQDYPCQVYSKILTIWPNGNTHFCSKFSPFGNISLKSPAKIWSSQAAFSRMKEIKQCPLNCSFLTCRYYENFFEKVARFKTLFITH